MASLEEEEIARRKKFSNGLRYDNHIWILIMSHRNTDDIVEH